MKRPIHGGNLIWAANQAGCPVTSIIDFSASINPLGPPNTAITAFQQGVTAIAHYPDPHYLQLRLALGKMHNISPDWIFPGNGAAELLTWAGRELANLKFTYLIVPCFQDYWRALQGFGAKIKCYPFSWESKTCLLDFPFVDPQSSGVIINNPHNPTGKLFHRDILLSLLEKFALVVVDEAFMDFLTPHKQQSLIPMVGDYPNLVIIRSLTKFYSIPGLRLGYAIAHPSRLQQWQLWRDPWSVNSLAVAVGEAVLNDHEFQQKTWSWLVASRKSLLRGLSALKGLKPFPSAANFLLVKTQIPSSQLQQELLEKHHILIRDCLNFPELGNGYFRVAVRSEAENQQLLKALAKFESNQI
ncbi:threonine-phosphate decarboxylase CobD [Cyanobacterium sp. uoEpiScrs1]|uniref:threonine-phosphate decarboxylase CobD n=1 Tax=Cyanobacterium sp. uoEpiScrs1 TaxID=2976343 RepID=UPI00226A549C|nr:threonine-phosphate decarboxylase CobD [Cyanobacterium sp. uoEpiScrs1]